MASAVNRCPYYFFRRHKYSASHVYFAIDGHLAHIANVRGSIRALFTCRFASKFFAHWIGFRCSLKSGAGLLVDLIKHWPFKKTWWNTQAGRALPGASIAAAIGSIPLQLLVNSSFKATVSSDDPCVCMMPFDMMAHNAYHKVLCALHFAEGGRSQVQFGRYSMLM